MDQLEIINASGDIEFYDLNPAKGLTNIGQHPENDVVLEDPRIAQFQMMLDHRQKPFRLMMLSDEGDVSLRGVRLSPNETISLKNMDRVEIGGYTLILFESPNGAVRPGSTAIVSETRPPTRPPTQPLPAAYPAQVEPPVTTPSPAPHPAAATPGLVSTGPTMNQLATGSSPGSASPTEEILVSQPTVGVYDTRPRDQDDNIIRTEISEVEWTIEAGQAITFEVTITNGGQRVDAFYVMIDGLRDSWVEAIEPPEINLNERGRDTITVTLKPPREQASLAGDHHFAVVIGSANNPDRSSWHGATLTINPFYNFAIGELDPRRQTIPWRRQVAETTVWIENRGNSEAIFNLDSRDEEQKCSFEFEIPGQQITLSNPTPLTLAPQYTRDGTEDPTNAHLAEVRVRIFPRSRPLFLRKRLYRFNVSATLPQVQQAPLARPGELSQRPLLGILPLLLLVLLFLLLCGIIFRPNIYTFTINEQVSQVEIEAGQEVMLGWSASPFTSLRLRSDVGSDIGRLDDNTGERMESPPETTTYTLEASNFLSSLPLLSFLNEEMERKVAVDPIEPNILRFEASPGSILIGEEVILSWDVDDADTVTLITDGEASETLPQTDHTGQRVVSPNQDTTYNLEAVNRYGEPRAVATVLVAIPTGTPIPPPSLQFFTANPNQIIQGESVSLNWNVSGADSVTINPIGPVPPQGPISHSPQETILYTLLAVKEGAPSVSEIREVIVDIPTVTPTPTATPAAPEIVEFSASKTELVIGGTDGDKNVTLLWVVKGEVTDIQLANKNNVIIQTQLEPESQFEVPVDLETDLFTLIAFNGEKSSRKSVALTLATPTPIPTEPPPPPTPLPTAELIDFKIVAPGPPKVTEVGGSSRTYNVQIDTEVTFQWETSAAAVKATFRDEASGAVETGTVPVGQAQKVIIQNGRFTLVAENANAETTQPKEILVRVVDPPPPDPPSSVFGKETADGNEIDWVWRADPTKSAIVGFRIYRADVPNGAFAILPRGDENSLIATDRTFTDEVSPTCGKAYYVVAVYQVLTGEFKETPVSLNTWFSAPCP